jgi:predicted anti-sigma-YlaC factor YlaD
MAFPSPPVFLTRLAAGAAILLASGCSLQHLAVDRAADALAASGNVYAGDDDPELVGAASPFGLKLMDGLLAESPRHRGLLLAAARGYTQYAYAYVELPADELEARDVAAAYAARERARRLYLRARDYGLRGLAVSHPQFAAQLAGDPDAAVAGVRRDEVPLLYWTAASWGAAIALGKDDPALLAGLPQVQALADRALALDAAYADGAIEALHISLAMSRGGTQAQRVAAAMRHLEQAVALSRGLQAAPYVTYAEAVALPTGRRDEFTDVLDKALAIDPQAAPEARLANTLFQRRARWLRGRTDELFPQ